MNGKGLEMDVSDGRLGGLSRHPYGLRGGVAESETSGLHGGPTTDSFAVDSH